MPDDTVDALNRLDVAEARRALQRCCGSSGWVEAMCEARPFANRAELFEAARQRWADMERDDILEAFDHHPRIGADLDRLREKLAATEALSSAEQASVARASEEVLVALRDGNRAYEARFGHIFVVCATGKSAAEMLALLEARLDNDADAELAIAAAEQHAITELRLVKLLETLKGTEKT